MKKKKIVTVIVMNDKCFVSSNKIFIFKVFEGEQMNESNILSDR